MTNRARPTWPEGAADSPNTQRPAQGGRQSAAPGNPASNGRSTSVPGSNGSAPSGNGAVPSGNGSAPGGNGQRPSEFRPQPRPGTAPARPQQPARQPRPAPSTPGRPEPWSPGAGAAGGGGAGVGSAGVAGAGVPSTGLPGEASYGKTEAKTESFGDRMNAARQAVLEKAAAVKAARPDKTDKTDKAVKEQTRQSRLAEKDAKSAGRPQTRKARLRMSRIDPWSVMKTAFLLSIAFGIVTWVAVFIIWSAIGAAGVFDNINSTVQEVLGTPTAEPFRVENYVNTGKVMGFTTLLACADVLIITALATLGSFLYNIAATLLGGLEITLASED
jgi:hypothetical protein